MSHTSSDPKAVQDRLIGLYAQFLDVTDGDAGAAATLAAAALLAHSLDYLASDLAEGWASR